MFWKRVISAIILIPVIIFLVWWGGYPYAASIVLVSALMLIEFWGLSQSIREKGGRIFTVVSDSNQAPSRPEPVEAGRIFTVICGTLACIAAVNSVVSIPLELALALALLLPFSYQILRDRISVASLSVDSTILGTVYIGWAFGHHMILLRDISGTGRGLTFFLLVTRLAM